MIEEAAIRLRHAALDPVLDERGRRRFAPAEAMAAGRGGVTMVARITGLARSTIDRGMAELRGGAAVEPGVQESLKSQGGAPLIEATEPRAACIGTRYRYRRAGRQSDHAMTLAGWMRR